MVKKKVGIVTHHWLPNFGANLQAYASHKVLTGMGFDVKFVDFRPAALVKKYAAGVSKEQHDAHDAFVSAHLPLTRLVENQEQFEKVCFEEQFDYLVTGSDAVFRVSANDTRVDLVFPNPFWLVTSNLPDQIVPVKVAYAPSAMGSRFLDLSEDARVGMRKALEEMTSISVRDQWTLDQIRSIGCEREIAIIPDPVFALHEEIKALKMHSTPERPYILMGIQGRKPNAWMRSFTAIAAENGYDTVALPTPEGKCDIGTDRMVSGPTGPLEWLKIIACSSGYVGCRFHPVVLSVLASVPVFSFDLYHGSPLDKKRSKTWLFLKDFGFTEACVGKYLHGFISPSKVWNQLERQRSNAACTRATILQKVEIQSDFLNTSFETEL